MRELSSLGVQPEVLLCRSDRPLPEAEREKIALFCNVPKSAVIQALDARSIYDVPLQYHAEGLDDEVLRAFRIEDAPPPDLTPLFSALAAKPMLAIRGELSDLLSQDVLEQMRALKPDLQTTIVPNVGHAPQLDEPEAWEAVLEFLAKVE